MPFEFIRSFTSFAGVCALAFVCIGAPSIDGPFEDGVAFRLQYLLDRAFYSCNAIDGEWGRKSEVALATYCAANGLADLYERNPPGAFPRNERLRFFLDRLFPGVMVPLRDHVVSEGDVRSLSFIPNSPEAKSRLVRMGYQSLLEMYAEKAHMTESAFKRLNPRAAWPNPRVGTVVRIPSFAREEGVPHAASLRVSLSRYEVTVFDGEGRFIALFPCSIAARKSHLPPPGEICVRGIAPHPNYTYRAESGKGPKYIFPPGPNNPVGSAWIGLSIPSYGIHGTPYPERIGRAESHGCFRLANWNAERLRDMCTEGISVTIVE